MNIRGVLTDFARTGGVGVLKPGALLDDVSGTLGPPVEADCFPQPSCRTITFAGVKEAFASAGVRWELDEFPAVRGQFAALVELGPVGVRFTFHVPDPSATDQDGATLHSAISRSSGHVCGSGA
ncbi:hypothetical protein AB0D12_12270 [Streptomyces sp. NPDC048479]|uniref:hypothetical protein n=1 Tax=Streptomyces sp. NPDC048479 TaxID=3154725 RepID=UPI0034152852